MGYTQLTLEQRYHISALFETKHTQASIALTLGVHKSTISRELKRNSSSAGYFSKQAERKARKRKTWRKKPKISEETWSAVEICLRTDFSPEQTNLYLKKKGLETISHGRIYQHIWADQKAGGDLYKHLRCRPRFRKKYGGVGYGKRGRITGISIDERPAIVDTRSRIGDWEADTIWGKGLFQGIVTLVERKSRFVLIAKVANKTAENVTKAITTLLRPYPNARYTLTSDNGKEFSNHEEIAKELNLGFYFAHPYHSWERGTNENTNGLLRQYFPKKSDFKDLTDADLEFAMHRLNNRPRKILNLNTPQQVFEKTGVALTT